ncbi:MAG: flagellar hook-basal body complex protein, partial [Myxococcota bacterium]
TTQEADGESTLTTFAAFDSLGNPLTVNLVTVLTTKDANGTQWDFYATAEDDTDLDTFLGTGTASFDTEGQFISLNGSVLTLDRTDTGADNPLQINLAFTDPFGSVSALVDQQTELRTLSQDGFPIGSLEDFDIGLDGVIVGSFTNGLRRTLGQIPVATFPNNLGLRQVGGSLYEAENNSGNASVVTAGTSGGGVVVSRALELSNVELSEEFVNLITASTGFSASSRIITTSDDLLLTRTPVRMYAGPSDDGEFGRTIAVADIDDDGSAELIVSHYKSRENGFQGGAVRIYRGGEIVGRPPTNPITADEADWRITGGSSYEYLGMGFDVAHFDSDNHPDLLIGAPRAEQGGPTNSGVIRVYSGAVVAAAMASGSGYDATGDTPLFTVIGTSESSRLGQAIGAVGRGGIASLAGYDSTYGTDVGAPFYADTGRPTPQLLALPGVAAGHEFGQAIALFDADGDGDRDLIVGGPGAADSDIGGNSGQMVYYPAVGSGFADSPVVLPSRYPDHNAGDRHGYSLSTAGDFNDDGYDDLAVVVRGASRPSSFGSEYANPSSCPGTITRAGAVLIYLGSSAGLEAEPAFIYYGYGYEDNTRLVRGGFDFDNDGYGDLLVSSYTWSSGGGFAIVYGRPASGAGITVLCSAERYLGVSSSGRLGYAAAPIGDINGDGCDEFAVGAPREDLGESDQGSVRVLWGWGGSGCFSGPRMTTLVPTVAYTQFGTAVAGGGDVDGDGIPDLVVGGSGYREDFTAVGGAWLVPGWYLADLPRQSLSAGSLPSAGSTQLAPLLPEIGEFGRYGLVGEVASGLFGDAVALVRDPLRPSRAAIAVGIPRGSAGGSSLAGGVAIYRWNSGGSQPGIDDLPYAIVGGESMAAESLLGSVLVGDEIAGRPALLVGAPLSDQRGVDIGAGYVVRFD